MRGEHDKPVALCLELFPPVALIPFEEPIAAIGHNTAGRVAVTATDGHNAVNTNDVSRSSIEALLQLPRRRTSQCVRCTQVNGFRFDNMDVPMCMAG